MTACEPRSSCVSGPMTDLADGTFIFAPLAHLWHMRLENIKFASSIGSMLSTQTAPCYR